MGKNNLLMFVTFIIVIGISWIPNEVNAGPMRDRCRDGDDADCQLIAEARNYTVYGLMNLSNVSGCPLSTTRVTEKRLPIGASGYKYVYIVSILKSECIDKYIKSLKRTKHFGEFLFYQDTYGYYIDSMRRWDIGFY